MGVMPRSSSSLKRPIRPQVVQIAALAILLVWFPAWAKEFKDYAADFQNQLSKKILPYWYDTAIDRQDGGYLLSDDAAKKAPPATEKQLVTQSRMIWGFS